MALDTWSAVANVRLSEVVDSASVVGDLRFARSVAVESHGAHAWAYLPGGAPASGDVWVSPETFAYGTPGDPGTFNFHVFVHEIGHALGLKHPFEDAPVLSNDSIKQTVMSYSEKAGVDPFLLTVDHYPETPMPYDVAAIQYLYGANTTHNSGDTEYAFSSSGRYRRTIWDGGGTDTIRIDGSGASVIDLRAPKPSRASACRSRSAMAASIATPLPSPPASSSRTQSAAVATIG